MHVDPINGGNLSRRNLLIAAAISAAAAPSQAKPSQTGDRVRALFKEAVVWDNHTCLPLRPGDTEYFDQLQRHRDAGVNLVCVNASFDAMPWSHAFKMLATFRTWLKARPNDYVIADSVESILRAKREGKLAVSFDLEGGVAVDDLAELIEPYYALGVRWMLLAYNQNNRLGGGCNDEDYGLTDFGKRVIREMERVGMVLCCSHTGHRTVREAIDYSTQPVIFSHSNASALFEHYRNIPDELILACAETGGVINVNGIGMFLGANDNSTDTIVRQIEHIAEVAGPEHVGIGLDYVFDTKELDEFLRNNPNLFPDADAFSGGLRMVEPERFPLIAEALVQRGWSDADIRGVLGDNNLRVARAVWKPAT